MPSTASGMAQRRLRVATSALPRTEESTTSSSDGASLWPPWSALMISSGWKGGVLPGRGRRAFWPSSALGERSMTGIPTRRPPTLPEIRVLQLLRERERTVSELAGETGALQGRLSSHLACLRWCGFVATRRKGRLVYYRLSDDRIPHLLALADEFLTDHADSVDLCRIIGEGGS